ncbi:WD40 repeat-like protein [Panus rudis PR-1116 ss-1]|nr:WD40 repeat-like protein [Panus rudis PR-1116 ss-1]
MALVDSPAFTSAKSPLRSVTLPAEAYVLSLASINSHYAAASSAPLNTIHLFDKANLRKTHELQGHEVAISSLRTVSKIAGTNREALISCGKDGIIKVWDERSGSAALQMNAYILSTRRSLLCCDVSADGMTVAAGTDLQGEDASLLYWDIRQPAAPRRFHTCTHSDDITAVHFLKSNTSGRTYANVLLSASSDGLVCTSNPDEDDEDEAGLHVGNWGCSIAQAGWIHGKSGTPAVWTASDMETFGVWSHELDLVRNDDIRQPSVHRQDLTWITDYLIGCHTTHNILPDHDNELSIFTGSNEGDVALLTRPNLSDANTPWLLHRTWTTGHVGVVRSLLWDEKNNVLLTGGEDSKLNAWSSSPLVSPQDTTSPSGKRDDSMDIDEEIGSPTRKRRRS